MNGWALVAIALALAMDAFAVAVVAGLTPQPPSGRRVFRLAFHFGLFQAMMPVIGWGAGRAVYRHIAAVDHWIAFALLGFVGGRMIWEALHGGEGAAAPRDPTRGWDLVVLSVATSIDALAVGLSLAMVGSTIVIPALVIGVVAAALTAAGMLLGRWIGRGWGKWVEVLGGVILVAIGIRTLWEHLSSGGT